jgi:membrane protease YdiL (CAAX protease family)
MLTFLLLALGVAGTQPVFRKYLPPYAGPLTITVTALMVYVASARLLERRRVSELDPRYAPAELGIGLLTGFALFSAVMAILWAMAIYHIVGFGNPAGIGEAVALAILSGTLEELLFRGILFRISSRLVGTWGALLFTSAFFGLAHLANKGATFSSGVAIMLEAGMLLGAAYALTQRLWLPIGLHIAWNFTESSVYGMQVSGNSIGNSFIRGSLSGPPLLTGGAFGPEASISAVAVCFALAMCLLWRTVKLGRIEAPAWKHRNVEPQAVAVCS